MISLEEIRKVESALMDFQFEEEYTRHSDDVLINKVEFEVARLLGDLTDKYTIENLSDDVKKALKL